MLQNVQPLALKCAEYRLGNTPDYRSNIPLPLPRASGRL